MFSFRDTNSENAEKWITPLSNFGFAIRLLNNIHDSTTPQWLQEQLL